jgi:hypothetical protein
VIVRSGQVLCTKEIISQSFAGNSTPLLGRSGVCFTVFPLDLPEKPLFELAVKLNALAGASPKGLMEIRGDIGGHWALAIGASYARRLGCNVESKSK